MKNFVFLLACAALVLGVAGCTKTVRLEEDRGAGEPQHVQIH